MAMTYIDVEEYKDLIESKVCLDLIFKCFSSEDSWAIGRTVGVIKEIMEGRQDAE